MEFFMGGFIYISVILMLSFVLAFMGLILSKKKNLNREKLSSFECGFDPMESSRNTFSLRFFLLAIVFLIFDIEIVLLFPYIYSLWMGVNLTLKLFMLTFIFVLIFGLIHEFNEGSLDWS